MRMAKVNKTIIISMVTISLLFTNLAYADDPPMPGIPQTFWGNAKYTDGENLEDGSIVRASVDGENYTTTVVDGTYGYYTSFYVEDPGNDNLGKTIKFYINDVFTGTTKIFDPGTINLNLTIEKDSGDGDGDTGGGGGGAISDLISPIANINAPSIGFVNQSVSINASGSLDSDGEIVSYEWTFGDNSSGIGSDVIHTYVRIGNYTISLLVTDDDDLTDTAEALIKIMTDTDKDKWGDSEEEKYDTDPYSDTDFPIDFDGDRIPDNFDSDDDNDGLSDYYEEMLGSDSMSDSDVLDISEHLEYGFLVDLGKTGEYDLYFDISRNKSSQIEYETDTVCLIDNNFDGSFDYKYDISGNVISIIDDSNLVIYIVVIFLVIIVIALGLIYKRKIGSRKK